MTQSTIYYEKRKEKRYKDNNKVMLESLKREERAPGKKICHAVSQDLSLSGMKIECNTFFPVNSFLKINLSLSKLNQLIKLNGIIRWVKSKFENELFSCGIEFVNISPENNINLISHIHGQLN